MVARNEKNPKTSLALNPRGKMCRSSYIICEISRDVSRSHPASIQYVTIFTNHNQRKMKVSKYVHYFTISCLFTISLQISVCYDKLYWNIFLYMFKKMFPMNEKL